jgi:hypothetical protein
MGCSEVIVISPISTRPRPKHLLRSKRRTPQEELAQRFLELKRLRVQVHELEQSAASNLQQRGSGIRKDGSGRPK